MKVPCILAIWHLNKSWDFSSLRKETKVDRQLKVEKTVTKALNSGQEEQQQIVV